MDLLKILFPIFACLLTLTSCRYLDHISRDILDDDTVTKLEKLLIEVLELELSKNSGSLENIKAKKWLKTANQQTVQIYAAQGLADWNLATNITTQNEQTSTKIATEEAKLTSRLKAEAEVFKMAELETPIRRQIKNYRMSSFPKDTEKVKQMTDTSNAMTSIYNKGKVCGISGKPCLPLEPDIQDIMYNSRDPEVLLKAWIGWRDVTSPIRPLYTKFVKLRNEGAQENGYSDYGQFWRDELFDDKDDLEKMAETLWAEVQPLYLHLQAYVRHKLKLHYGEEVVGNDGAIPAHLLGNMWAQEWNGIFEIVQPYKTENIFKQAEKKLKEKYDVKGLFRLAEEFYTSIGLQNMSDTFWKESMFTKPDDRDVQCHAAAFDLYKPGDYRIKMCSEVNMEYLETSHHEMGHIEYYMAYKDQPVKFRDGGNSAFHEAVGDTMALSVLSRKHLIAIGLLDDDSPDSHENKINVLLHRALFKVAFLPFGYLIDKWRYDVFRGRITPENYNQKWWQLRLDYQGVTSPVPRSEDNFDAGAKFHIPANSPYISYFFSFIIQFQFYERLCDISGHTGDLHTCDFYQSKEAGSALNKMLSLGSSIPWQDALEKFTGSRDVSAKPILEYFRPLQDWLEVENAKNGVEVDWWAAEINWQR